MKTEIEVVKPNLQVVGDSVYFSVDAMQFVDASRSVGEAVKKHIGALRVTPDMYRLASSGKGDESHSYTIELEQYLAAVKRRWELEGTGGFTNSHAKFFGLGYLLNASSVENKEDVEKWEGLRQFLEKPDEFFDNNEKVSIENANFISVIFDRQKTLERARALYEELGSRMPEDCALVYVTNNPIVGVVGFGQVKSKDRGKIEEAKAEVVERLKGFNGRCLSLDAHSLHTQHWKLLHDAGLLVNNYGDILLNPDWKERFFRYDP